MLYLLHWKTDLLQIFVRRPENIVRHILRDPRHEECWPIGVAEGWGGPGWS